MKVVLRQDVKDLGKAGQLKDVADGYARNYLFPRRLAVPATAAAVKDVEARQQAETRRQAHEEQAAHKVAERLKNQPVRIFPKVGEAGRLYGSVTAADIAEALEKELGQPVDKRRIVLEEPIRMLGEYQVPYHISRGVTVKLTVQVERQQEEGRGKG